MSNTGPTTPDPIKTLTAGINELMRMRSHMERGETEKATIAFERGLSLVSRSSQEYSGEIIDHEYIDSLCKYGEYDVAQQFARYKRQQEQLHDD